MLNEMTKNLYIEPYYHRLNVAGASHPCRQWPTGKNRFTRQFPLFFT